MKPLLSPVLDGQVNDGPRKYAPWLVAELQLTVTFPAGPIVLYVSETVDPEALAVTGELEALSAAARAEATCADVLLPGLPYGTLALNAPITTVIVPASYTPPLLLPPVSAAPEFAVVNEGPAKSPLSQVYEEASETFPPGPGALAVKLTIAPEALAITTAVESALMAAARPEATVLVVSVDVSLPLNT